MLPLHMSPNCRCYFRPGPDDPAFGAALPDVPAPAPFWDAGADFAGALDPPPLLSAGVFRLEAPAPGAPPVPEELMLEPVLDAPDPLWAPAVDVAIRAAPSASIVIFSCRFLRLRSHAARLPSLKQPAWPIFQLQLSRTLKVPKEQLQQEPSHVPAVTGQREPLMSNIKPGHVLLIAALLIMLGLAVFGIVWAGMPPMAWTT